MYIGNAVKQNQRGNRGSQAAEFMSKGLRKELQRVGS